MRNYSLISILVIGFLFGCNSTRQFAGIDMKKGDCMGVDVFLSQAWKRDTVRNIFIMSGSSNGKYLTKDYYKCFESLNRKQVVSVLGEPNERHPNVIRYYLDEGCFHQDTARNFEWLEVGFDDKNKVIKFGKKGGGWIP